MKILLSTLLFLWLQQNTLGQVSGKLTVDGQPIPFANVLLLNSADTSLVKGTLTNQEGFTRWTMLRRAVIFSGLAA